MDINTLTETLALALADAADIKSWAQANYSRDQQVYVSFDPADPPKESAAPFLIIYPAEREGSRQRENQHYKFVLELAVYDEEFVQPAIRTNLTQYAGLDRSETFRQKIQAALVAALPANLSIAEIAVDYSPVEDFPFFIVGMEISLTEQICIGGDYLG